MAPTGHAVTPAASPRRWCRSRDTWGPRPLSRLCEVPGKPGEHEAGRVGEEAAAEGKPGPCLFAGAPGRETRAESLPREFCCCLLQRLRTSPGCSRSLGKSGHVSGSPGAPDGEFLLPAVRARAWEERMEELLGSFHCTREGLGQGRRQVQEGCQVVGSPLARRPEPMACREVLLTSPLFTDTHL